MRKGRVNENDVIAWWIGLVISLLITAVACKYLLADVGYRTLYLTVATITYGFLTYYDKCKE